MKRPLPDAARRRLLATARNVGAAGAAAAVLGPAALADAPHAPAVANAPAVEPEGYRVTERIRRYYQLARY